MTISTAEWDALSPAQAQMHLPLWPIGFFTLWDFYYAGVRPFDHLAVAVIVGLVLLQLHRHFETERAFKMLILVSIVWLMILVGALQHADILKPMLGLLEGALLAVILTGCTWRADEISRLLKYLILLHAGAILLQFLVYHAFHVVLNYEAWLGSSLRVETAGLGLRPAGLFLEPGNVALMLFSLLSLFRLTGGKSASIETFGLTMMLLSLSLWGWGAAVVYLLLFRPRSALLILPVAVAGLVFTLVKIGSSDLGGNLFAFVILRRIVNPSSDPSAASRYDGLSHITNFGDWQTWIGQGISNDYSSFGGNGLSFLLTASGIFGTILVLAVWFLILPRGRKVRGLLALGFMLSAATQWTFMWWWAWLALAANVPTFPQNLYRRNNNGIS